MGSYAVYSLDWSSFGYTPHIQGEEVLSSKDYTVLPDGDQISFTEEVGSRFEMVSTDAIRGIAPYELRVVLKTGAKATSWKEIKAMTKEGQTCHSISTHGNQHGPRYMILQVREGKVWFGTNKNWIPDDLRIATVLVFSKVNADGSPIAIYELHNLHEKGGKSITFSWEND